MSASPRFSALSVAPQDALADAHAAIHADVWRADTLARAGSPVVATGDAQLNAELPGGGWPVGALTEIFQPPGVHSEWRLLAPALARCGHGALVLVQPPQVPFTPALRSQGVASGRLLWVVAQQVAQRLWAAEQALRCAQVDAVLVWLAQVRSDQLRRLQMAAAEHAKLLFVFRPQALRHDASPAALRLSLSLPTPDQAPHAGKHMDMFANTQANMQASTQASTQASLQTDTLLVELLKRRGPPLARVLHLPARSAGFSMLLAASHAHALDCTSAPA